MSITSSAFTHPGHERQNNEDAYYVSDERGLWIVCDGMGGHQEGNYASHLVTDIFAEMQMSGSFDQKIDAVTSQIYNIHRLLQKKVQKMGQDAVIGTTLVMMLVEGNQAVSIHSGDSRCYILRDDRLSLVTQDHAKTVEHNGEDRKMLTKALSAPGELSIEMKRFNIQKNDTYFLCSDGLYEGVTAEQIKASLQAESIEIGLQSLTKRVLQGEAHDNLTGVIVRVNA